MTDIDIKDALYFIVICVVVLEIHVKKACFIDSKKTIHLPDSLMNRLNQSESAVFQLCSFTIFPKDPFFKLFNPFYSLL